MDCICIIDSTKFVAGKGDCRSLCSKIHFYKCPCCGNLININDKSIHYLYFHNSKICSLPIKILFSNKKKVIFSYEVSGDEGLDIVCDDCRNKSKIKDLKRQLKTKRLSITCQKIYGVDNPGQAEIVKNKMKDTCYKRYGCTHTLSVPSVRAKGSETKKQKYGDENYNNREKAKKTYLERTNGLYENPSQNPEVKKKKEETCFMNHGVRQYRQSPILLQKFVNTCRKKYGVDHPMQNNEIWRKAMRTMNKNNKKSTGEYELYKYFLNKGLKEDVDFICEYNDNDRYPFNCDFYLPRFDLFIELNGYGTHGGHAFDGNNFNDVQMLLKWWNKIDSNKSIYLSAINTWLFSDFFKRKKAKDNKLNYIMLGNKDDIQLFKDVFDCLL